MKEDRQFVTALARGLDVLRCFTPERKVMGATEIAQMIGLPQPTVWRLCHTLAKTGYLVPTAEGKLRIGAPVLSLGYAALASLDWLQVVRPHMQQMAEQFSGAVALAERHRDAMIYLERCQGQSLLLLNLQVGSRLRIYSTSMGLAYLAALSPEQREAVIADARKRHGAAWAPFQAGIDAAVASYQAKGFVVMNSVHYAGVAAAAVPVRSSDGRTVMALNCGGPSSLFSQKLLEEEVGPALVELGRIVEAHLPDTRPPSASRWKAPPKASV